MVLRFYYFYFMCICVLPIFTSCATCVRCPCGPEEDIGLPRAGDVSGCELLCQC